MTLKVELTGLSRKGDVLPVRINELGELTVGKGSPSPPANQTMSVVDTAYNFAIPEEGKNIYVTAIHLYADKNVGAGDASVVIYANASGIDGTDEDEIVFKTEMVKQTQLVISGLNIKVTSQGRWLNGKTNDNNIFANIFCYQA